MKSDPLIDQMMMMVESRTSDLTRENEKENLSGHDSLHVNVSGLDSLTQT